jgi:hypothetical protein
MPAEAGGAMIFRSRTIIAVLGWDFVVPSIREGLFYLHGVGFHILGGVGAIATPTRPTNRQ